MSVRLLLSKHPTSVIPTSATLERFLEYALTNLVQGVFPICSEHFLYVSKISKHYLTTYGPPGFVSGALNHLYYSSRETIRVDKSVFCNVIDA